MCNRKSSFLVVVICGLLAACNPTRYVPEGEYLLVRNKIAADTSIIGKENFDPYIKQKPNKKILGLFRFHLWVYNIGRTGKDGTFKTWLRRIGEEPVVLDSSLTERTRQQFHLFLAKNGFFNSTVTDTIKTRGKKKAIETYYITYNTPYTVRSISYDTRDTGISTFINIYQKNSLIVAGERYNEDVLDAERERITKDLKDKGYYFFNRNYITYQVDSSLGNHQVDVFLYINKINENIKPGMAANTPSTNHQAYTIRNIYLQTDYNQRDPSASVPTDTLLYNGYYILSHTLRQVIRPSVLTKNIFIKPGDLYHQSDLDYSYQRLQDLNLFKFINLLFVEVPRGEDQPDYLLDLNIQLTPMDKMDVTTEVEATNTGGNLGFSGSVGYRNKNTFRGAEVLEVKLKGGLEAIPNFNEVESEKRLFFFNTYEIGPEVSLGLKKLLFLEGVEKKFFREANPRTSFTLGYNLQNRPDYNRTITNASFAWSINFSRRVRFQWFVADINSVNVNLSQQFRDKLEGLNDPRLLYTYDTHIISSTRPTITYTNQNLGSTRDFIYLRFTPEAAFPLFKSSANPSEFFKADVDFSFHHIVDQFNSVIYRIAAGYGLPYGNSTALPFEKSFFAGGANSVRAWSTRTLGPGSYANSINIEQSGDIKIESNIEYRSELVRFPNGIILEAAAFIDAGNVWTRNEDISRPGGMFEWKHVMEELGIGAGTGMRFNFNFLVLRLDVAVKLRDPSLELANRWVYPNQKFVFSDINWNIAIGYPF